MKGPNYNFVLTEDPASPGDYQLCIKILGDDEQQLNVPLKPADIEALRTTLEHKKIQKIAKDV